jgi:hypothetical protein
MPRMSSKALTAALVLLLAAGSWPWLGTLGYWPMAPDSGTWIERSRLGASDWAEWVFATQHFGVGWRPLTALTYTLNHAVGGFEPLFYRATDLGLHLTAVLLMYVTFRRLFPARPAWAGLVAAGLFAAHPVTAEVVPFIARRSYSLGTALALGGLVLFERGLRGRSVAAVGGGVLIALACFANEASVLFAAVLPVLAWNVVAPGERTFKGALRACLLPGALVALAVLVRLAVVGGIGGYSLPESLAERAPLVFEATWRGVAAVPVDMSGEDLTPEVVALVLLLVAAPYYVWASVRGRGLRPALLLWLAGYAVLYAAQGVWFPRQAYVAVVPLALLVADVIASERRALHLVPQLLLVGTILFHSPTLRGPDPVRTDEWHTRNAMITLVADQLETCREPATVHTVMRFVHPPDRPDALRAKRGERDLPRLARQPVRWLRTLVGERDVLLEELIYYELNESHTAPSPGAMILPDDARAFVRTGGRMRKVDPGKSRAIELPPASGRNEYLYIGDPEEGTLTSVAGRSTPSGP